MAVKKPIQGSVAVKNLPSTKSRTQLMFLDDLNCAAVDSFEIQPPLELLRQILSQGITFFLVTFFLLMRVSAKKLTRYTGLPEQHRLCAGLALSFLIQGCLRSGNYRGKII